MSESKSIFEALNILSTLAPLCVNLGGSIAEFLNHRAVWFRSYVGARPATPTSPARDIIQPTNDYFIDMAALARELQLKLIEHAEAHHDSSGRVLSKQPYVASRRNYSQKKKPVPIAN